MNGALHEILSGPRAKRYGAVPKVELPSDDALLSRFAKEILAIVKNKGIYLRDNVPVLPHLTLLRLEIIEPQTFRTWVERYLVCYKRRFDRFGESYDVLRTMTQQQAEGVLKCPEFLNGLPKIEAVNPERSLAIDPETGEMAFLKAGYDEKTKTLTFDSSNGFFDETLTLVQCTDILRHLLVEFPFSGKTPLSDLDGARPDFFQSRSLAVQIAAMLSQAHPCLLPIQASRLGFIYNANTERSGKTLLCKIAIIPFYRRMAVQSWTDREDDLRKVIDAVLLAGARYILFDNVRGRIQSQTVEALMTSATWRGRVLGRTQMFEVPNQATIFFTGNDCFGSPDIAHRCLVCDLFVEEANIQERKIVDPINDTWLMRHENRFKILSALSGLVRHWDAAGRPKPSGRVRVGFEDWCNIYGGIVEFAGLGDCLAEPEVEKDVDTESADIRTLIMELVAAAEKGSRRIEFSFQQIINAAHHAGVFGWALDGKEEYGDFRLTHRSQIRFGKLLRKYAPLKPGMRKFRTGGPEVVQIHCTSRNQNRRYIIEIA
jgi:hypothetical protein